MQRSIPIQTWYRGLIVTRQKNGRGGVTIILIRFFVLILSQVSRGRFAPRLSTTISKSMSLSLRARDRLASSLVPAADYSSYYPVLITYFSVLITCYS